MHCIFMRRALRHILSSAGKGAQANVTHKKNMTGAPAYVDLGISRSLRVLELISREVHTAADTRQRAGCPVY